MNPTSVRELQTFLTSLGLYNGEIDGDIGEKTLAGIAKLDEIELTCKAANLPQSIAKDTERKIAWGAKVSPEFKARVLWIADEFGWGTSGASDLMACMAFETGEQFKASTRNLAGSSGTGLIQFMSYTAETLGTTVTKLAAMTDEDQLNYVYKYFVPVAPRIKNLGDLYMAILWPRGIGKDSNYVLWNQATAGLAYKQNKGLDYNKDGKVTRGEAERQIQAKLKKGLGAGYVG